MATDTYDPNGLIVGHNDVVDDKIVLITGQNLARGAVLGKITASGKYTLSASGASDGSEAPVCVLAFAVDATAADKDCRAYFTGEFDGVKLVYGTGHTAATVNAAFRAAGQAIFVRTLG